MTDATLALYMDRFVRRVHLLLHKKAQDFDTEKVGASGAIVLLTLAELGTVPLSVLTRALHRDKSQMTRSVRPLETKGLIARTTCEGDARITMVALTEKGQQVVATHRHYVTETIDEVLAPLSETDRDEFKRLLQLATDLDSYGTSRK